MEIHLGKIKLRLFRPSDAASLRADDRIMDIDVFARLRETVT